MTGSRMCETDASWKRIEEFIRFYSYFRYWRSLFEEHKASLQRLTRRCDWTCPSEMEAWMGEVEAYDPRSAF